MRIVLNPPSYKVPLLSAALAANGMCPSDLGISGLYARCSGKDCFKCWNEALKNADSWNPVSKQKAPKEGKIVLTTMLDSEGGRFVTETLDKRATRENKVIAWQYPPDIYKGEI